MTINDQIRNEKLQYDINKEAAKILALMMMMTMNCFCGMVDRQKAFSLISSQDHYRDPHHCESLKHREQGLNLHRS